MSFSRQLVLAVMGVVIVALVVRTTLTVSETGDYLSRQLASHARDAARSLGLSISLHLAEGDPLFVESIVDSMFDSGDYTSIRVLGLDGGASLSRSRPVRPPEVPAWFANAISIEAPEASAELTAGWQRAGTVHVRSHPGYAYEQLWASATRSVQIALVFLLIVLVLFGTLVRWMLRPLELIETQARAVAERRFPRIEKLPETPEFRRMAEAMNFMTGSVEKTIADISEQAKQLQRDAYLDPVTGVRNRRAARMDIEQLARDTAREGAGALMLVTVSGLDAINKTEGYEAGDTFMRAVADAIAARLRNRPASLGRYGGALFSLVLTDTTPEGVAQLAQELVDDLGQLRRRDAAVAGVHVGAVYHAGAGDADVLIERCESALRNAEQAGSATWHLWRASETVDTAELSDELRWRALLEHIIATKNVELEAQPVRAAGADTLLHLEVLARFRGADGALVPAGKFIPVASRLGLSAALDVVIVEEVLEVLKRRADSDERLAVNLSAAALRDASFRDWLRRRLKREGAAYRSRLCLEVTEHFAAGHRADLEALIRGVRPLGVSIGVDHCGAGDVSLSALRGLQLDYAKLYGAFVSGIDGDRERQNLVRSLVSIAHGMGLAIVAEFVETEAELQTARGVGFDAVQGFHVGRPTALG